MRKWVWLLVLTGVMGGLWSIPVGDTLTVIQKPLPNLPTIVVPGENIFITCKAPINTTNWEARLLHGNTTVDLPLSFSVYDAALQMWRLGTVAPTPPLFEVYDLEVTASGGIEDIARHCVGLISSRKSNYYFVHITDAHMPTTMYYYEDGAAADSSSMVDMREVIRDINLIHPEFVLFTGDLVNEGELEDFQNLRYYTRAQKILNELDVPVFVTAGNHDLGGWDTTPPSDGTARRNWWRFFGWRWLQNPPSGNLEYTQDYSFDYGMIHFIGMEAYVNYDEWLYDVYGEYSFIPTQLDWLEDDLATVPSSHKIVLFYHYDFSDQISLTALGADLALYGHGHQNAGSLSQYPWNLETDNICDGSRAYRPIRVDNGNTITPKQTQYAGNNGTNLSIVFSPANTGVADSVTAVVQNRESLTYDSAQIKFLMPQTNHGFRVHNGTLTQVDRSGNHIVCYVTFNLAANSTHTVSIAIDETSADDAVQTDGVELQCYPNPFRDQLAIAYAAKTTHPLQATIYNLRGQTVRRLELPAASHQTLWDGTDDRGGRVAEGVYLVRIESGRDSVSKRVVLLK